MGPGLPKCFRASSLRILSCRAVGDVADGLLAADSFRRWLNRQSLSFRLRIPEAGTCGPCVRKLTRRSALGKRPGTAPANGPYWMEVAE